MGSQKYALAAFLEGRCPHAVYLRWLDRKARAHVKRDRKRGNAGANREAYMVAIHAAVLASGGLDEYTGAPLAWEQISSWDNEASRAGRRAYKKTFADLPTVDHVGDGSGSASFVMCGWRTNDCKSDLSRDEFVEFCRSVVAHHDEVEAARPNAPAPDGRRP
jgi:hypothetical protein